MVPHFQCSSAMKGDSADIEKRDFCLERPRLSSSASTGGGGETDAILSTVGDFGRWQAVVTVLLSLVKIPVAWFQLGIVFLAPPFPSPPTCARPPGSNISLELWRNISEPYVQKGDTMVYDSCHIYNLNYTGFFDSGWNQTSQVSKSTTVIPCMSWEYDRSLFEETIISEWDLVCQRTQLSNIVQMTFMFGILIGNVLFGIWADRYGRKVPLIAALTLQAITAVASALVPWFEAFVILRFLLALATGGTMLTSFVICMEIVGGWWRTAIPILYQIPFGIGQCTMSGLAYYLRHWRHLQLTLGMLSAFFILFWWVIPESPRWLLSVGRRKEALEIIKNAAKKNGRPVDALHDLRIEEKVRETGNQNVGQKNRILDLMKRPHMRTITLCIFCDWFIGGLAFFGLSQYLAYVGGNLFTTVVMTSLSSVPGTLACVYIVERYGRRKTIIVSQMITGIATILILAFPIGEYVGDWPRVLLVVVGTMGISVAFPALYLYSGELFPTVIRNSTMGVASMFGRIGSMAAPFLATLGYYGDYLPPLTIGATYIVGTFLIFFLPETKGKQLPDSLEDTDNFYKEKSNESSSYQSTED
ncbi:organic cation transporter protein-like isoform X2 [Ischnura elegans]|uniref:organic cation transporter protein-like isoform X2 n=1 Tax=Ischnura elegans TaxID=197161 RepID=UPI001ED88CB1|nr:organic cation transporter protein-like isoform X2 [Ischnura elegans]